MQSLTSRSSSRGRFMRLAGTGATALLAATAISSAAGAATTPPNAPIGATGSVAALSGSSMEVQSENSGQTTVSWTGSTTFTKSVTEAVSALTSGDCVTVSGTPSKKSKTTIAARTITVSTRQLVGDLRRVRRPWPGCRSWSRWRRWIGRRLLSHRRWRRWRWRQR